MTSGCLANARLVLEDRIVHGAVFWRGTHITDLREGTDVPKGATDCAGDYVIPGLVELHTDNLERHIQPRPGVDWPHVAALLAHDNELIGCGITTVFDAMRVGSITSDGGVSYAEYARGLTSEMAALREAGILKADHKLHLRAEICSETLLDELATFTPEDEVGLLSLMDHTPGQRQFRDISKLRAYVMGKRGMDETGFQNHIAGLKDLRDRFGAQHETGAVSEAERLGAVLASHDDTTEEQVAISSGHGVALAEFPTTREAAEACRRYGIPIMMGAPNIIRGGSHSGNVSALELARHDLLDILSSDYVPSGLLLAAWQLATEWSDLPRAVATVSATPARSVGLTDRGIIAIGARADLMRIKVHDGTPITRRVIAGGNFAA
ncbi:alpha-D-ribose 1-methylphosphonate 5-triphosphate diphosphatase [Roseobacter sp. HKCCA0434]|uniref:alpha-D-ribose 1-methylphosphonate 5-triphosphate diphosphatase n=1 Tax=Roseobacter sp. HKCCA0434 TaxID=3079297 RepID=UPI002905DEC6|nr:alpha-D-ribose 1-methylphosphonate 5-triphosphate diphosphatase [Roseobacter sp. HKCCA0434]